MEHLVIQSELNDVIAVENMELSGLIKTEALQQMKLSQNLVGFGLVPDFNGFSLGGLHSRHFLL